MKTSGSKFLYIVLGCIGIFFSCQHKIQSGDSMTSSQRSYLQAIGLLDTNETIILFDSQAGFEVSGNFYTDKRIASYWIDSKQRKSNYSFYSEIDTLLTYDRTSALTYASYLEVLKKDGERFKVYVDGDSTEVWTFFEGAFSHWKTNTSQKYNKENQTSDR
jgi:hypothetical protein